MNNVFKEFKVDRKGYMRVDNPRSDYYYGCCNGYFHPSCSFTQPIKNGKLTKYAKILVNAYINDKLIFSKDAIKILNETNWQTIRYSKLVREIDRGIYDLSDFGKRYCELICRELVKAAL